ncbi:NAD(P)-dependent dehydrogenase, short-chain alcohol dehydrogenase family [Aliiroseovarius halocynthiae]|uniref:SDR family oxidoreductase n=1 Tax=Aliiroseovarius halocynthiae TaxID=985055 RepID=A0A545SVS0_9RHOB|nr:SDR family NAD(P)-dependent oxidoreductase [Aliiroseovarius halocynthiae]TQV69054.1 SDR family oxidoreductase [Aliiroseovarius halocynthiae]SMR71806.1 NAD(P)-dependent dehydrogenase, short-chain alcohol dehydrogenase family [Aliiroseovarius halocynthiae]
MQITENTVVTISGGASGLGGAVAEAFAAAGAKVGIFDLNEEAGQAMATKLGGAFAKVDVSDPTSVADGFKTLRAALGQERVMVNCAGIAPAAKTQSKGEPHDAGLYAKVISVNLIGTFNCASQAAAGMAMTDPVTDDGERGVIINTASVAAMDGQIGQLAYASSKAGVVGLTLPMARDLMRDGIRVMAIAPGIFMTPMLAGLPQEVQDSLGAQVPFPSRLGDPTEYAGMVRHIVENAMLNGEVIRLDGAIRMAPR